MRLRPHSARGFTLIELLIVVAIIGMLAAMLVPNLLDALQKAKQKRAVQDIKLVGTSAMAWLTDQATAAAAGASSTTVEITSFQSITKPALESVLVAQYAQYIPLNDPWKQPYDYYLNTIDPLSDDIIAIRSSGSDIAFDSDSYTIGAFDPTEYEQDIVWADGFFIRWPQKLSD